MFDSIAYAMFESSADHVQASATPLGNKEGLAILVPKPVVVHGYTCTYSD